MKLSKLDLLSINRKVDITLIACVLLLCIYGVTMVFSATQSHPLNGGDSYFFLKKQILAILIGLIGLVLVSVSNYNRWKNYLISIYLLNIGLLVLVLFVGDTING